jgi:hypothetical protein
VEWGIREGAWCAHLDLWRNDWVRTRAFDLGIDINFTYLSDRPKLVDVQSIELLECLNCETAVRREQWNVHTGPMHALVEDVESDWLPTAGYCYTVEATSLSLAHADFNNGDTGFIDIWEWMRACVSMSFADCRGVSVPHDCMLNGQSVWYTPTKMGKCENSVFNGDFNRSLHGAKMIHLVTTGCHANLNIIWP